MYGKSCVLATGTVRVDADGDTGRRAAHARLIGALRGEHASYLVENDGGLLALFDEPAQALRAAERLRAGPSARPLRFALSIGDEIPTENRGCDLQEKMLLLHEGRSWLLSPETPQLMIGRAEGCDIRLADPHSSRHHARIELRQGRCMLIDCSQNGTLVRHAGGRHLLVASELELPDAGMLYFSRPGGDVFRADAVQFQRPR